MLIYNLYSITGSDRKNIGAIIEWQTYTTYIKCALNLRNQRKNQQW